MPVTAADLSEIVADLRRRRGDTTTVEVKSAELGCPELADTLCAFGNMPDGGIIILGLSEADGFTTVGLGDIATLEQGVAAQARTAVTPAVQCSFQTLEVAGSDVLVCEVSGLPLQDRPARSGGQAYLRQSDGDYPMSDQELAQIELLKSQAFRRTHPDRTSVPGTSIDDLDPDLLAPFIASARSASPRHAAVDNAEILRRTGIITTNGELSIAGIYALGSYPQQHLPSLSVTAAVQLPRGSTHRTRDLVHLDGPLPALLESAMEWVRRNTRTSMGYDERGHGVDTTELPMVAVREIIANALVHRNLDPVTDSKRVEIRLLDDKLVVTSPGGLWGVSEQQLGKPDGKSAVNLVLYDACKLIRLPDGSRLIEGEGGGIREALLRIRGAGLRAPRFIDSGVRFTAVVSRHTLLEDDDLRWLSTLPDATGLTSEQRAILAEMRRGVEWTNAMVRDQFAPIDSVEARRLLQQLVDRGLVTMQGNRGTASYSLVESGIGGESVLETHHEPGPLAPLRLGGKAPEVLAELGDNPRTFRDLANALPFTDKQVRYALGVLREAGLVHYAGTQGNRESTYIRMSQESDQ